MPSHSAMTKSSQLVSNLTLLLFLSALLNKSGISAASLRDHRLRGAESNAPAPNEDMLKALEYIQSLRQSAQPQDQQNTAFERSALGQQNNESPLEDKSEELLQAVLSTLQQTEKAEKPGPKTVDNVKVQAITPHKEMPLLFEDDEKEDGEDGGENVDHADNYKRTNENVEEKYTPQNLATLQSVFDELSKMNFNFNSKRENSEEEEGLLNARDVAYDEGDWDEDDAEENRQEFERALDYLEDNDQETDGSFITKRSDDQDEGEMANLADFYLLKVLEQTEEEEQKKREIEEEEEEEEERMQRSAADFRNNIDPRMIYRLLQISQKYQIPPEDLIDMLRSGEITRLKVAPIYTKNTYKIPQYFSRRLPMRQKTPDEMRTERILKILGLSGDENSAQSPFRKQYKSTYARPVWRQSSLMTKQPQQNQRFPTKLKDDYDDTENELATFLAARMLSKYPTYKGKVNQKREETEEEVGSFERAVQDYFDHLESDKNENRPSDVETRGVEDFDNEEVMKLLSFVNPDEQDAKNTE